MTRRWFWEKWSCGPASVHTSTVPLATFDSGYALKKVDLPEYAQAGETLTIPIAWHTDKDGEEDHTQFLHFVHRGSGVQWGP